MMLEEGDDGWISDGSVHVEEAKSLEQQKWEEEDRLREEARKKIQLLKEEEERKQNSLVPPPDINELEKPSTEQLYEMPSTFGTWGFGLIKSALSLGPSSSMTVADGPGLQNNLTHKVQRFVVQCRRKDGEAWTEGGDDVQVRVLGPLPEDVRRALEEERMLIADEDDAMKQHNTTEADSDDLPTDLERLPVEIVDNSDGTYAVSYTPYNEGEYSIHIKLNGRRIENNREPRMVMHRHCTLDLFGCQVDGSYVEDPVCFQAEIEDTAVNLCLQDHVTVFVTGPDFKFRRPQIQWSNERKGVIDMAFTPDLHGDWEIDVKCFRRSIVGCPYFCRVKKKRVSLEDIQKGDDLDMPAHLTRIRVGLGWTFPDDGDKLDLDVSCIMLRYFMKHDHVFFNSLRSLDGSVVLSGDNRSGTAEGKVDKKAERANLRMRKATEKQARREEKKRKKEERRRKRKQLFKKRTSTKEDPQSDTQRRQSEALTQEQDEVIEDRKKPKKKKKKSIIGKIRKKTQKKKSKHTTSDISGEEASRSSSRNTAAAEEERSEHVPSSPRTTSLSEEISVLETDTLASESNLSDCSEMTDWIMHNSDPEMSDDEDLGEFAGKSQAQIEAMMDWDSAEQVRKKQEELREDYARLIHAMDFRMDVDEEFIIVELPRVSHRFNTLLFTVNVFDKNKSFEHVRTAYVRVVNDVTGKVLYKYELDNSNILPAVIVCKIHRFGPSLWKLHIIDEPAEGHTFNAIPKQIVGNYLIKEPAERSVKVTVMEVRAVPANIMKGVLEMYCKVLFDNKVGKTRSLSVFEDEEASSDSELQLPAASAEDVAVMPSCGPRKLRRVRWSESFQMSGKGDVCEVSLWGICGPAKQKFMGRVYLEKGVNVGDGIPKWHSLQLHPREAEDIMILGDLCVAIYDEDDDLSPSALSERHVSGNSTDESPSQTGAESFIEDGNSAADGSSDECGIAGIDDGSDNESVGDYSRHASPRSVKKHLAEEGLEENIEEELNKDESDESHGSDNGIVEFDEDVEEESLDQFFQ